MIAADMSGRLGNQMFIYAFAIAQSKKLKTPFLILHNPADPKSFQIEAFFTSDSFRPRVNRILLKIFQELRGPLKKVIIDDKTEPAVLLKLVIPWRWYQGYMQSEDFFKNAIQEVKQNFTLKPEHREKFRSKYENILSGKKIIVLHARRTDYKEFGNEELGYDLSLPLSYYDEALKTVGSLNEYEVYFVGDDITELKNYYGTRPNFHYEINDMITDFQLLQNADIAVISNSSFAWWAAYLNQKKNSKIIAPQYWLGFKIAKEHPAGISHVAGWTWVDPLPSRN